MRRETRTWRVERKKNFDFVVKSLAELLRGRPYNFVQYLMDESDL